MLAWPVLKSACRAPTNASRWGFQKGWSYAWTAPTSATNASTQCAKEAANAALPARMPAFDALSFARASAATTPWPGAHMNVGNVRMLADARPWSALDQA